MKTTIHNLSLHGISGIIFGIISILFVLLLNLLLTGFSLGAGVGMLPISFFEILISVVSLVYILISFIVVILINKKRRKKLGIIGWDTKAKKVGIYLISFLLIGGISSYYFVAEGNLKYIVPTALILFGILCLLAERFSSRKAKILGFLFLLNSAFAYLFPQFMLLILGISFGIYPIIYGIYTYKKV